MHCAPTACRWESYEDATTGLRVTVLSLDPVQHLATVSFNGYLTSCSQTPPAATLAVSTPSVYSPRCFLPQVVAFNVRPTELLCTPRRLTRLVVDIGR